MSSPDEPWFPAKRQIYLRARRLWPQERYCVLCRRRAHVVIDVRRSKVLWWEAFPICEDCVKEIPRALGELK